MHSSRVAEKNLESELIDALKNHEHKAFEDFYDRYAPAFFGNIKRTLYKKDVSEATLKAVFKTIWTSIDNYDPAKESLFTWALKISGQEISHQKIELVREELFYCQRH